MEFDNSKVSFSFAWFRKYAWKYGYTYTSSAIFRYWVGRILVAKDNLMLHELRLSLLSYYIIFEAKCLKTFCVGWFLLSCLNLSSRSLLRNRDVILPGSYVRDYFPELDVFSRGYI